MKKRTLVPILLFSVLAASAVLLAVIALSIVRYASVDETRKADCAIVLGAGTWEGEVSPVFEERLRHAVKLYREGTVPKIILTGGLDPRNTVTDAEAARRWTEKDGIHVEDVLIEDKSRYTHENFLYAKEIMEREGFRTALVVSDPLHMKRAMLCASDFGVSARSSPTKTSMYRSAGAKFRFLMRETGCYVVYGVWRLFRCATATTGSYSS